MTGKTINLDDRLYQYLLDVSVDEPDVLARLRAETAKDPMSMMQIAPEQGQFMAWLVRLIGAQRTLEVGVFTGYSALSVALALPEDGHIVACDISEAWTNVARRYWAQAGVADKIDLRLAPALQTLQSLLDEGLAGSFDFAFIDADKENYSNYYELVLQLLRTGGVIAIDNVLWSGSVADPAQQDDETNAIRDFNRLVRDDDRVDLTLLPLADGLTLTRKR